MNMFVMLALVLGGSPEWVSSGAIDGLPKTIAWDVSHDGSLVGYVDANGVARVAQFGKSDKKNIKNIGGTTPWVVFDDETPDYMVAAQQNDVVRFNPESKKRPLKVKFNKYLGPMGVSKARGRVLYWPTTGQQGKATELTQTHANYFKMAFVVSFDGWQAFTNPTERGWQDNVDLGLLSADASRAFLVNGNHLTTWKVDDSSGQVSSGSPLRSAVPTWTFAGPETPKIRFLSAATNGEAVAFAGRSGPVFVRIQAQQEVMPDLTNLVRDCTVTTRSVAMSPSGTSVIMFATIVPKVEGEGASVLPKPYFGALWRMLEKKPTFVLSPESEVVDSVWLDDDKLLVACRKSVKVYDLSVEEPVEIENLPLEGDVVAMKLAEDRQCIVTVQEAQKSLSFVRFLRQSVVMTGGE